MKKLLLLILIVASLLGTVQAANRFGDTFHEIQIVDENGVDVTDITNLFIYLAGTTTDATIYSDKNRQNTITIPMTEASTNTTLIDGRVHWWGPDLYDFSMTNGDAVGPRTNSGHRDRSSNEGTIQFPSYLQSISSTSYTDAQTITMGTGADWVFQGGNVAAQLSFTPAADDSTVNFGVSGTALNTNFNVFVGTALGFKLSSSGATHSMTYDGGIVNLNASSNFAVNICSGTSTGATTIGNSAGGAIALDTDTGITVNADDSFALTVSAGTIGLAATGGDITIDGVDSSVIIRGTEAASDAVLIDADAGSIDIDSADNITADAADDISLTTTDGPITLTAGGGTNGNVAIVSADDTVITASGKVTIVNTEVVTISGGATITGVTTIVTGLVKPVEIVAATNEIEITESGTVFVLTNATEYASTLPTVASSAGVTFRFIVGAVPSGDDYTVVTDSLEDKFSV
ncbi:MAG: hypothetical protein KAJ19_26770, partial [Gammaproteobacteria bacterium]|nr:hypothetical protein [Gammaproteobacteria bacterium]